MGETTGISWSDTTWNPWMGCTKVSEACKHCYMFRDANRYGWDPTVVRRSKTRFDAILDRKRFPAGKKVFTCSWSDFFHPGADEWRQEAWEIIRQRSDLILQILTKRPERILDHLPADWGNGWPNVWIGVTAENQQRADQRIPLLLEVPAAVHFASCEPLLGPIGLDPLWLRPSPSTAFLDGRITPDMPAWTRFGAYALKWLITGGESGPQARPSHPDWFRSLQDQCQQAGVAFHFKQWGEHLPVYDRDREDPDWCNVPKLAQHERWLNLAGGQGFHGDRVVLMRRVGVKHAGRELDGKVWDEMPEVARAVR